MDTQSFIEKAKEKHGNKYDYSLIKYFKSKTKVDIICPNHGIFQQIPNHHLTGQGCRKCGIESRRQLSTSNVNDVLLKFIKIHGNRYDYSLVNYINNHTNIDVICKHHGIFQTTAKHHIIMKSGCPKCAIIYRANGLKSTREEFINESSKIHNNKYDYCNVDYVNGKTNVMIICPTHGNFEQLPTHHLKGSGCPFCNDSKGELQIKTFLEKNNIHFVRNKSFDDCIDLSKLKFDFYLPNENIAIEFDGLQHFKAIRIFGGEKELINRQRRDEIKNTYCKNKSIDLLRIKYNENVENKLLKFLKFTSMKN